MGAMAPWHWAIVLIVLVLLFGSKRLPDAARGVGRSLRIFKSEMKQMGDEGGHSEPAAEPAPSIEQAPAPQAQVPQPPTDPPAAQPTQPTAKAPGQNS